ncbi:MAG: hypothetical protein CSA62_05020 [Planctomycetota bacterium]|nr:MAG: hypothetical protein CSA62_05020 [Planctomycetota bacterium]
MFPIACILIASTLALPASAQRPEKPGPKAQAPEKAVPKAEAQPAPQQEQQAGLWRQIRAALAAARKNRRSELEKKLDRYRPDLVLRYRDNASYLEEKFREIRKLDPELPELLLPLLFPDKPDRSKRSIAENSLRILQGMPLDSWRAELEQRAAKGPLENRLRALDLLSYCDGALLAEPLEALLALTPESLVPRLLEVIGRSGARSLAPKLLPFLKRPQPAHRVAAMRALAELRYVESLQALQQCAESLDSREGWLALETALQRMHPVKAPQGRAADTSSFASAAAKLLRHGQRLSRKELLQAIELIESVPSARFADNQQATGQQALLEALRQLLQHPFPLVNFQAAIGLRHLGDKRGVESILQKLSDSVKRNRRVPYVYVQRARAYEAFGKTREALKDIKDAIRHTGKGRVSSDLYFFAARLECRRGSASQVHAMLREAKATPAELASFRKQNAKYGLEDLIKRHRGLRRLFGD